MVMPSCQLMEWVESCKIMEWTDLVPKFGRIKLFPSVEPNGIKFFDFSKNLSVAPLFTNIFFALTKLIQVDIDKTLLAYLFHSEEFDLPS